MGPLSAPKRPDERQDGTGGAPGRAEARARIERLLAARPHFHAWPDGRPANWAVAPEVLRFIADVVEPGMATLETGAGQTTAAFCIAGARHVAVTPDQAQAERIRAYLDAEGVAADLTFIHRSSDEALPAGDGIPDRLDVVLIDGAHRFPFAMIDWHYTEKRVPVGGLVLVDDTWMPSVKILYDFLCGEDDWTLVEEFQVTTVFRRVRKTENVWDWADQAINRGFLERATAEVAVEPEAWAEPEARAEPERAAAPEPASQGSGAAAPDRAIELQLRGAKLQIKTLSRDLSATQETLRKTRDELWRVKGSKLFRASAALRRLLAPVRRLGRRLLRG